MLRINPPTAMLLLDDHVALQPGDCVIQNVANSAVGRHVIVLAKARGVRTINVVRRDDVAGELRALGADAVIQDGPDLPERAREAASGAPIRLGIDAVSGEATRRIADSVSDGAVVVNYGSLSGEDPVVGRAALTQRGVMLTGFILGRGLAKRSPEQVRALYADLGEKLRAGILRAPIDFDLSDRADQGGADPCPARRPQRENPCPAERAVLGNTGGTAPYPYRCDQRRRSMCRSRRRGPTHPQRAGFRLLWWLRAHRGTRRFAGRRPKSASRHPAGSR